jgi:hypothetical protein
MISAVRQHNADSVQDRQERQRCPEHQPTIDLCVFDEHFHLH